MVTDSSSTIEIYGDGNETKTILQSVVKVNRGVANFDNIGFVAPPGKSDMKFFIKSQAIKPFHL